jgi:hypothetical protein
LPVILDQQIAKIICSQEYKQEFPESSKRIKGAWGKTYEEKAWDIYERYLLEMKQYAAKKGVLPSQLETELFIFGNKFSKVINAQT